MSSRLIKYLVAIFALCLYWVGCMTKSPADRPGDSNPDSEVSFELAADPFDGIARQLQTGFLLFQTSLSPVPSDSESDEGALVLENAALLDLSQKTSLLGSAVLANGLKKLSQEPSFETNLLVAECYVEKKYRDKMSSSPIFLLISQLTALVGPTDAANFLKNKKRLKKELRLAYQSKAQRIDLLKQQLETMQEQLHYPGQREDLLRALSFKISNKSNEATILAQQLLGVASGGALNEKPVVLKTGAVGVGGFYLDYSRVVIGAASHLANGLKGNSESEVLLEDTNLQNDQIAKDELFSKLEALAIDLKRLQAPKSLS